MKLHSSVIAFALAIGFLAEHAVAAPEIVTKRITVSYADLDLSKPEGAHTLYRRIQGAARQVCSAESDDVRVLQPLQNFSACYRKAVDDAVSQVNRPTLTALHLASTSGKRVG